MKLLTNSEMRVWRRCKRRWWLSVYRQLRPVNAHNFNRPLGIGNRVHDCLAAYYDPDLQEDPIEHLWLSAAKDLEKHPDASDLIEKECNLADAMLSGYLEWLAETGEDQGLTVLEAERARSARLDIPGLDVRLLTKLDARVRHDVYGDDLALETKTVTSLNQHLPELRQNTQCLTEHLTQYLSLVEEGKDPEDSRGVLFNMLKKSKRTARATPPFYSRVTVRHSKTELRNHWRHVVSIATQIEDATRRLDAGEDHHSVVDPNPTGECHWDCEFFRVCTMIDDDSDHETALARFYETGDPLERYAGLLEQDEARRVRSETS